MKLQILVFILMVMATSISVSANDSVTIWNTNWNEMTLTQTGNQINGTYDYDDGEITGTLTQTDTGLLLTGWWRENGNSKACGDNDAWSGPIMFLFNPVENTFTSDWATCSSDHSSLDATSTDWQGSLISGSLDDSFSTGSTDDNCVASYNSDGTLHIPCVLVPNGFGGITLFEADLRLIPFANPMAFELTGAKVKE
jgi:hypothetical protein